MGTFDGRKEATGLVLFFCSVALTLMYYLPQTITGIVGQILRSVGFGLIGSAAFAIPIFVFYASIDFFFEKRNGVAPFRVRSIVILMLCVASLLAVFTVDFDYLRFLCIDDATGKASALKAITLLWKSGIDSKVITDATNSSFVIPGGVLGGVIALSLVTIAGKTVSICALITFLIVQIIMVSHISVKKTAVNTAKAISKATSSAYRRVNQYRQSQSPYSPTSQFQTGSDSPFVSSPTSQGVVPIFDVEYDSRSVKLPIDKKTGFIDVSNVSKASNINLIDEKDAQRTLHYGENAVLVDESNDASNADFGYTSTPLNPPLMEKKSMVVPSFLQKEQQQDFFDLGEDGVSEFNEFDPYSFEEENTSSEYVPGRVRRPNVDLRQDKNNGIFDHNVIGASSKDDGPIEITDGASRISINAETSSSNVNLNGREIDTSSTVSGEDIKTSALYTRRRQGQFKPAPISLLPQETHSKNVNNSAELRAKASKLEETLLSFGVDAKVINITHGPAITRYELTLATGIKVSKILNLNNDIMLAMATTSVRIEAPIPGKSAIGIEIPNSSISAVHLRSLLEASDFKNSSPLTVPLGRDIPGKPIMCNLASMPHLLIAGSTGSGKSVCLNAILISLLCKCTPDMMRMILIDPKVVELSVYNGIPHLIMPVVTDAKKAAGTLRWAVDEMNRRYKLFAESGVRDISGYNEYLKFNGEQTIPLIVIVIDELSDLMIVAAKEVEDHISRLAAMARAAGLHLIVATQRPSTDVITGVIKANIPSRIAFAVSSGIDSRIILDGNGAEDLLGKGDMLYSPLSAPKPIRCQGAFVSDKEVEKIVGYLKQNYTASYDENVIASINNSIPTGSNSNSSDSSSDSDDDSLLEQAVDIVIEAKVASVSILQRRLGIGYPRAARLIDVMEQKKFIGPFEGSKPRKVLINQTDWLEIKANKRS